jgi:hypothetical protein
MVAEDVGSPTRVADIVIEVQGIIVDHAEV